MIRFDAWYKERLSIHELPTVRDLLERADTALIADARMPIKLRTAEWGYEEPPTMSEVWEETEAIVANLLASPEIPVSGESVLIPSTWAREDPLRTGVFVASTEAVRIRREDLPRYERFIADPFVELTFEDVSDLSPNGWAYEMMPWEEILALPTYVPARFCEVELYQFVASVIEEATFYGTEQAESDEMRTGFVSELDEAMRELERAKAEGDLKKAFEQFDPTDFGFVDDRPREERAYDMRLSDLYIRLMRAGRMELWKDCMDLARRLP